MTLPVKITSKAHGVEVLRQMLAEAKPFCVLQAEAMTGQKCWPVEAKRWYASMSQDLIQAAYDDFVDGLGEQVALTLRKAS